MINGYSRFFQPSKPLIEPEKKNGEVELVTPNESDPEVAAAQSDQSDKNRVHLENGEPTIGEIHPAAEFFPMLDEDELRALVQDIKDHGLQHPIVRYQGKILDGRNRWQACARAGVDPTFEEYSGDSPVAFVVSANLHRRQLGKSQLATLAVEMAPLLSEEAKKRQQGGVSVKVGQGGKTLEKAAEAMNVSTAYAEKAKKIKERSPVKFAEVHTGKKTVSKAEKEIKAEAKIKSTRIRKEVIPHTNNIGKIVEVDPKVADSEPLNTSEIGAGTEVAQGAEKILLELTADQSMKVVDLLSGMGIDPTIYESLTIRGGLIRLTAAMQKTTLTDDVMEMENSTEAPNE